MSENVHFCNSERLEAKLRRLSICVSPVRWHVADNIKILEIS